MGFGTSWLGWRPSLPSFRRRSRALVQHLRGYYYAIRFLRSVHRHQSRYSPFLRGPGTTARADRRPPRSRQWISALTMVPRPRGVRPPLAKAGRTMQPSASVTTSAPRITCISWLNSPRLRVPLQRLTSHLTMDRSRLGARVVATFFPRSDSHRNPIASSPGAPQPQRLRGKVPAAHMPADQKSRPANHMPQSGLALLSRPADPAAPRAQSAARAGKHKTAEPAVIRTDQIPQLTAAMLHRPLRMRVSQKRRLNAPIIIPVNQPHMKTANLVHTGRNTRRRSHRLIQYPRVPRNPETAPRRRQPETARIRKLAQRGQTMGLTDE